MDARKVVLFEVQLDMFLVILNKSSRSYKLNSDLSLSKNKRISFSSYFFSGNMIYRMLKSWLLRKHSDKSKSWIIKNTILDVV